MQCRYCSNSLSISLMFTLVRPSSTSLLLLPSPVFYTGELLLVRPQPYPLPAHASGFPPATSAARPRSRFSAYNLYYLPTHAPECFYQLSRLQPFSSARALSLQALSIISISSIQYLVASKLFALPQCSLPTLKYSRS